MSVLEDVYAEWESNPKFKIAFKSNPRKALEEWHFVLNESELKMILTFHNENEELDKRVNK